MLLSRFANKNKTLLLQHSNAALLSDTRDQVQKRKNTLTYCTRVLITNLLGPGQIFLQILLNLRFCKIFDCAGSYLEYQIWAILTDIKLEKMFIFSGLCRKLVLDLCYTTVQLSTSQYKLCWQTRSITGPKKINVFANLKSIKIVQI